jgi:hypothetical protein
MVPSSALADHYKKSHPFDVSAVPARKPFAMPQMTSDELAELLTQLELSTEETRDELLTDFLVRPYPTKVTQDN